MPPNNYKRCPNCGHKHNIQIQYCPECEYYTGQIKDPKEQDIQDYYEEDGASHDRKYIRKKQEKQVPKLF